MPCRVYRWAFNCSKWHPTKEEFGRAFAAIQQDERDRINRFVYQEDAKRALVGRLLIRKCILEELEERERLDHQSITIKNCDLLLRRSAKGRPIISPPLDSYLANFDFNVSHHGDFAVLAAIYEDTDSDIDIEKDNDFHLPRVGIDVMKVENPRSKEIVEFFRLMRRQLTDSEWQYVEAGCNDESKLLRFYRFWCLKESYVKALGIGIGFEVGRLQFEIKDELGLHLSSSTSLFVDGERKTNWQFLETMLDDDHCVAVASRVQNSCEQMLKTFDFKCPETFDCFNAWDNIEIDWINFSQKQAKP